jgi:secernin
MTTCDTLVVLGTAARDGHTLFAKNSDRPPTEAQPLFQAPRAAWPAGASVRCQYVEIPQARETLAVLGSRPWWLWGFEHGVNECRVAIGNEALHTREPVADSGLLGMDLVRLGLERGHTAADAKRVITDLLERHGQGGRASHGVARRYDNSFLIVDPTEAWVVETSGRHWVARRVRERAAISNLATIERDWDEASAGIAEHARDRGWWDLTRGRLDFRAAFEDPERRYRAEARHDASCRFLGAKSAPTLASTMRHLRDHYDGGTVHRPGLKDGDPRGWSVCMHPDPGVSATAASMVAELPADPAAPMTVWCSMASPCASVFLPITFGALLPEPLTIAGETPDDRSAWWAMKALTDAVIKDPERLTPLVQARWEPWEREMIADAERAPDAIARALPARVRAMLERCAKLLAEITGNR